LLTILNTSAGFGEILHADCCRILTRRQNCSLVR
jgi:hypothetical protein